MTFLRKSVKWFGFSLVCVLAVASGGASTLVGCGPFTDVSGGQCPFILELYYLGIAGGTSATTFDPAANVTRGQVAVFMGAAINYIKRTSNPMRIGARQNLNVFQGIYEDYKSANTDFPNGFCTDGGFNFVANQGNNKIDVYNNGSNSQFVGTYTTVSNNNRIACSGSYLYITSVYGTTVKKINLRTAAVTDPWVTVANGAGDIALAGFQMAVTTNTGLALINTGGAVTDVPIPAVSPAISVVVDQNGNYWVSGQNKLARVTPAGVVGPTVTLNGNVEFYSVSDGANIWVPLYTGSPGYDIVSTNGTIIDHKGFVSVGATDVVGGVFDGQHVIFAERGQFGCASGHAQAVVWAFDAASHNPIQAIASFCDETYPYTIGFDGRYIHALFWDSNNHFMW